ncbi:MAG TPA: peptidase inhibitor family I36 protein [Kofleriaceae bacterium]
MRQIICHAALVAVLGVISACAVGVDPTAGASTEVAEQDQALPPGVEQLDAAAQRPATAAALATPWSCFDAGCVLIRVPSDAGGATCPVGYACMYQHANRRGVAWGLASGFGIPDFRQLPCAFCSPTNFNDNATSWHNNSGVQYCWYYDINYSTKNIFHHMGNGDAINVSTADNDKASSLRPC